MIRLLLTGNFLLSIFCCVSQPSQTISKSLDSVFIYGTRSGMPGCACAVTADEKVIYKNAVGWADVQNRIPLTNETVMSIGSVSKHFTAYAMLMLELQGKLSMNDPVTKYVELPFLRDTIRLYHLLTHSSGFHECTNLFDILFGDPERMRTMKRVSEFIRNHRNLEFAPGTKYSYNNSGYSLAAFIIEKVSRQSFPEFLRTNIFLPLEMTSTNVITVHNSVETGQAVPYKMNEPNQIIVDSLKHDFYGFTGVFTTVNDLLKWDKHLAALERKADPLYIELTRQRYLDNNKALNYGYGLEVGTYRGQRLIAHSGRDNGYTSYYLRFPEKRLSFIAICNNRYTQPWKFCYQMADQFLPEPWKQNPLTTKSEAEPISYKLKDPKNYTGIFWTPQKVSVQNSVMRIELQGDDLYQINNGRKRIITPISPLKLSLMNSAEEWLIEIDQSSRISRIISRSNQDDSTVYYRVNEFDDRKASQLKGKYRSDELGITIAISKESEEWVLIHSEMGKMPIIPLFEGGFDSRIGLIVWDARNPDLLRLFYERISRLSFYRIE